MIQPGVYFTFDAPFVAFWAFTAMPWKIPV